MDGNSLLEHGDDVLYAVVTDDVGREYRSSEDGMRLAMKQLRKEGA
jgi:hypothetical protein